MTDSRHILFLFPSLPVREYDGKINKVIMTRHLTFLTSDHLSVFFIKLTVYNYDDVQPPRLQQGYPEQSAIINKNISTHSQL